MSAQDVTATQVPGLPTGSMPRGGATAGVGDLVCGVRRGQCLRLAPQLPTGSMYRAATGDAADLVHAFMLTADQLILHQLGVS